MYAIFTEVTADESEGCGFARETTRRLGSPAGRSERSQKSLS